MSALLQNVLDAISFGALYALYALGVAIIFSVARVMNFAHGSLIMAGAYTVYLADGLPILAVLGAAILVPICLALLIHRMVVAPLGRGGRAADPSTVLVATFAVSIGLQQVAILGFTSQPKSSAFGISLSKPVEIGSLTISGVSLLIIVVVGLTLLLLSWIIARTQLGLQLRAATQDFWMARVLGVRSGRVIASAFLLSGLLAAIAGVLLVVQTGSVSIRTGVQPVLIAFVATVIGGLGSLLGAALGGLILGVITVGFQTWLPGELSPYRDAFIFAVVIILLLVRPQGLLSSGTTGERI